MNTRYQQKKVIIALYTLCIGISSLTPFAPLRAAETNDVLQIVCSPVGALDPAESVGAVVFAKMPASQVLGMLQTLSGRTVIPGAGLPGTPLAFRSANSLRRDEAILAVETLLRMNGVILVKSDAGFIEARPAAQAMTSGPILLDGETLDDLDGQQIYGRIFDLKHTTVNDAFNQVRGMLSPGGLSSIAILAWRDSLLIFDSRKNLEAIERMLDRLDQPVDRRVEVFVVQVRNSNVQNLNQALSHAQRNRANPALSRAQFHINPQANHIVVVAPTADRASIEALVASLDNDIAPLTTSRLLPVKNGNIRSVYAILNGIIRHQQQAWSRSGLRADVTNGQGKAPDKPPTALQDQAGSPNDAAAAPVKPVSTPPDVVAELQHASQDLQFSSYMSLWMDLANNAIVAYGTPSDIARAEVLIAELDHEYTPTTKAKTITIRHAEALAVAATVSRIVTMQQQVFQRQGIGAALTRAVPTTATSVETDAGVGYEFTPFAMLHADRPSNAIFLYGTPHDVERMESLIAELDRDTAPITRSQMVSLQHADADTLSRLVAALILQQRRTFQQRGLRTTVEDEKGSAEQQAEWVLGFEFSDFASVIADRRSNGILVYGTDGDIRRITAIVEKADIAVEPITTSRILPLRHADVNHLARVLQIIVSGQRRALQRFESVGVDREKDDTRDPAPTTAEGEPALQFSPFLSIVPDARNNALIVYGTHADVNHVARLVEQTDVEVAPTTFSKVFLMRHAQSTQVAGMFMAIINNQRRAMVQVQSQFRAVHYGTDSKSKESQDKPIESLFDPGQAMQFSPYVSVVANPRNNSVLVYGTSEDIKQIEELVTQTDIEVAPRTQSRVFVIRHGDANEIVRTLNPLIQAQQRARERESTLRRFFRPRDDEKSQTETETETDPLPSVEEGEEPLVDEGGDVESDLQFSPYISLTADKRANTVIAYGTPFDLEQLDYLVNQIDRLLPQVRIEVVIAEVSLSEGQVSGLSSFGFAYDNPFDFQRGASVIAAGQQGVTAVGTGESVKNTSGTTPAGSAVGRGGVIMTGPQLDSEGNPAMDMGISFDPFSMRSVFRVARDDRNVRILSAPSITTMHNRPAHINVGEARPIITSSSSTLDRNLATRSEIEYRDIGIQLTVRPLISEDGVIQLDIEQVVETVVDTQTIDNNVQPIIGTRRANSFVSVQDKQLLIMGGLQSVETTMAEGRVFILGDIPLLGRLFRPRKKVSTVRELIIFIRPELVSSTPIAGAFHTDPKQMRPAEAEVRRFYDTGEFEHDPRGIHEPEPTRWQRWFGRRSESKVKDAPPRVPGENPPAEAQPSVDTPPPAEAQPSVDTPPPAVAESPVDTPPPEEPAKTEDKP
ncbi:MAG TPA: hypothetical protein DCS43_02425 [Verrucomicrobia bacterium]|nr:hypothetical protein [Verrucomicrobiota bacterium]